MLFVLPLSYKSHEFYGTRNVALFILGRYVAPLSDYSLLYRKKYLVCVIAAIHDQMFTRI